MSNPFLKLSKIKAPRIPSPTSTRAAGAITSFKSPSLNPKPIKNVAMPAAPAINLGKFTSSKVPKTPKMAVLKKAIKNVGY